MRHDMRMTDKGFRERLARVVSLLFEFFEYLVGFLFVIANHRLGPLDCLLVLFRLVVLLLVVCSRG